ncbi:AEX-3 domain-containing protein [Gamsiella multidivaricata]|uniref:AEX-3 domain-containing protein n=1 Tax=Gamsiella multidivaricata TaxID=101098 RepID=UPI00221ECD9D|nr:AEX-3 domain-containing protein [Gamsiella multidivaricata]KAI7826103.1 AEX-3 domain-containing protein [Gamsiella multidivaricata]
MNSPKRIADYFFIVGLRDDTSLYPPDTYEEHQADATTELDEEGADNVNMARTAVVNAGSTSPRQSTEQHQGQQQQGQPGQPPRPIDPRHLRPGLTSTPVGQRRLSYAAIAASNIASPKSPSNSTTTIVPSPLSNFSTTRPSNRARSQTMTVIPVFDQQEPETLAQRSPQPVRSVRPARRLSTASMVGPPRRTVTLNNVNNPGGALLQHRPSYRYVSAGTLYKCVQEGIEHDKSIEGMQENIEQRSMENQIKKEQNGLVSTPANNDKATTTTQETKGAAVGKNGNMIRNRTKLSVNGEKPPVPPDHRETKPEQLNVHPAERAFTPVVTCRYPETNWKDAEPFPTFLPMFCFPADLSFKFSDEKPPTTYHSFVLTQETGGRSYAMCVTMYERPPRRMHHQFENICQRWTRSKMSESEIEYARAIKIKIARERELLKGLQIQLREERTLGRRARQAQLQREVSDSEEKLSLLHDQMKPWKGLFIEAEDAWIPRCIGVVSTVPYHYLLRDWLLAVVVACAGGVEHPGLSVSSLRLESYVKNLIHEVNLPPFGKLEVGITINNRVIYASRPALNSVPIVKNFSLFPLFRCLTAEDIVTVLEVILSEGRVVFLSSYLGMLTLASESFLYLLFPLYWQGVYIPILPSALMTCLQAPVPYIIGVERRTRDSDFPPEDACVVDLDKGTVEVQLAPVQLPSRQRRKLIQSLEQYAPASAIKRPATSANLVLGPPAYVKEAFPHSRLTLFCGVSRAPRWSRRGEPTRPVSMNGVLNGSSTSIHHRSSMDSRSNGMTGEGGRASMSDTLSLKSVTQSPQQPLYSKVVGGMARSASDGILDKNQELERNDVPMTKDTLNRAESMKETSPLSQHSASESFRSVSRKVLSPTRARSSMFEGSRKHEGANNHQSSAGMLPAHPGIDRQNSGHSMNMSSIAGTGYDGPGLRHRASFASIDSSSSSVLSKSPVSTITSNTMVSINGPSSASTTAIAMSSDDDGGNDTEKIPTTTIEGHALSSVSTPVPMSLLNCRCGICSRSLAPQNAVYRCEGCSLYVHAGCIEELLYPCVPRGFDESGVCWSVLQMWAGLMKGYRSGIVASVPMNHQSNHQHNHQQQQFHAPNRSPRRHSHAKQLSNAGSEVERDGRDRLSWASFQRWTGRNGNGTGSNGNVKAGSFSPPNRASASMEQLHQQPHTSPQRSNTMTQPSTRPRKGTTSSAHSAHSTHSDFVAFHKDTFMKGVDKEAKPFMSAFTESQAFAQFIQDRMDRSPGDPEIMFFDEVIKAKINRSRFRIGKEDTKFLDDPSYGVQGTVKAPLPSGEIQIHDNDERRFPTKLDPAYL